MKRWPIMLLCAVPAAFAAGDDGVSFVNEGVVAAPIEQVWSVFTTSEGYKLLGPALVEVDLRVGGMIRSRYGADGALGDDATIENAILAFEPPTMIATRIQKPPATFPFKEAWKHSWTVVTLKPLDESRTFVRVASLGFGDDEESVAMRRFFEAGNQLTIETLQKHFDGAQAR
jgi:uncharacterized protein YndB with AHSA1/START domain